MEKKHVVSSGGVQARINSFSALAETGALTSLHANVDGGSPRKGASDPAPLDNAHVT